jgi:hypothetical protein
LNDDIPGPAKKTFQTASHAVGSCNPSIKGGWAEAIIFPFLFGTNDTPDLFRHHQRIKKRGIHLLCPLKPF